MAWERRGLRHQYLYYTKTGSVGGVRTKEYFGNGPTADHQAQLDRLESARRSAARSRAFGQAQYWAALEARLGVLRRYSIMAVGRAFRAAGFHQHHRSEWRKARKTVQDMDNASQAIAALTPLMDRAIKGDTTILSEVGHALDLAPDLALEWGNLTFEIESRLLIENAEDPVIKPECRRRFLVEFRRRLRSESTSPLEELLIQEISLSWLYVRTLQSVLIDDLTSSAVDAHERRIDRAQRRYLAALKSLAQVRRLITPITINARQLNLANQQINIMEEI